VAEELIQLPVPPVSEPVVEDVEQPVLEVRKETAPADAPVKVAKKPAVDPVAKPVVEPILVEVEQPALEVRKEAVPVDVPVEVVNEPVAEPVTEPAEISQLPDKSVSIPGESSDLLLESPVEVPFELIAEVKLETPPVVKASVPQVAPVPAKARRGDLVPLAEVDIEPVQTRNVQPRYHPIAQQRGQQGTVTLDLLINESGRVSEVNVVREIPKSRLNDMAVLAAQKWVYEPAIKDGVAVKVWKRVAIAFQL
jgi:TonB family protein